MKDVMIDLETMGTRAGCAIVSIGAVDFDLDTGKIKKRFYSTIRLQTSLDAGLFVESDTVAWWLTQNEAARKEIAEAKTSLLNALNQFSNFLGDFSEHCATVWSHGASFDIPVLEAAYAALRMRLPWSYSNVRDTRTIFDLAGVRPDRSKGTKHIALDDAVAQAEAVAKAYKKLRLA